MNTIVSITGITKRFTSHPVITGCALDLQQGTTLGLLGLNGAGKTTLLRLILGLLKPDTGTIKTLGVDPWQHHQAMYADMGVVLEHDGFYGNLSPLQNLRIFARARGLAWPEVVTYLHDYWAGCAALSSNKKTKLLSRGQRMQCALCRAFMGWPKLLILDEPTIALDLQAYEHFASLVQQAKNRTCTTIVSTHQLDTIESLCSTIAILQNGVLSIVLSEKNTAGELWIIRTTITAAGRIALDQLFGTAATIESDRIMLTSFSPETDIPRLVQLLTQHQCPVFEIKPIKTGLKQSLLSLYQSVPA